MDKVISFSAGFRILNAGLKHAELNHELGAPTFNVLRGDLIRPSKSRRAQGDVWLLESSLPETSSIDAHLRELLLRLSPKRAYLRALLDDGIRMDFFAGFVGNSEAEQVCIDNEFLQDLAALGIPVSFSFVWVDGERGEQP